MDTGHTDPNTLSIPPPRLLVKQLNKKEAGLYKSMFKALGKGGKDSAQHEQEQAQGQQQDAARNDQEGPAAAAMEEDAPAAEAAAGAEAPQPAEAAAA